MKQDAIAQSNVHHETLQLAKTKEPYLYSLFVEKSQLRFKSQLYLRNKQKVHTYKNLRQILTNYDGELQPVPVLGSYGSVESGYSVKAKKKYCDFTGFHSGYTHRETGLRYFQVQHCKVINKMQKSKVDELLSYRAAVPVLK